MFHRLLLIGLFLLGTKAFAHGQDFFVKGGDLPDDVPSYVLLPDGSRHPLNSELWRAMKQMEKLMEEGEPTEYLAPWQRLADAVEEATHQHFWVRLTGAGIRYWKRYGTTTFASLALFETAEHSIIPVSGMCVVGQAACVTSVSHLRRFAEMVRFRYPLNEEVGDRVRLSAKQLRWNLRYWWNMKFKVYQYKEGESPAPNISPMAQYFLVREKVAFLEMQLTLALDTIDKLAASNAGLYLQLEDVLATVGRSIDRYSTYLSGLPVSGRPIDDSGTAVIDKKFHEYFHQLHLFFESIERGSVPLTTPLGIAIWNEPRELLQLLRSLQINGCEKFLTSGDALTDEKRPRYRSPLLQSSHGL